MNTMNKIRNQFPVAWGLKHTIGFASMAVWLAAPQVFAANWAWDTAPAAANFSGANWTSGTVPGAGTSTPASGDSLYFGTSSVTNLNNDDSAFTFAGLTFNVGASSFTLTNNAVTSLTADITNNSVNPETINLGLAMSATRNFLVTSGGTLTVGGVVSGTAFGLTKIGGGTLDLNGSAVNTYTGGTAVNLGTLLEDFSNLGTPTSLISASSALTLGGGTLAINGKPSATTAQTFASTAFTADTKSAVTVNQNSATAINLTLAALTRNAGSTLDITLPTAGSVTTTTTTTTGNNKINGNGIAYATANGGATWLTNSGSGTATLGALSSGGYSVDTFAAGTDADIQNNDTPAAFTDNTVRFNVAGKTLTLNSSGVSQITAGGILVTPNGTGAVIASGGGNAALQAGSPGKEIVIHDYSTLTISAPITNNTAGASSVTLSGPGTTTLSGANLYTGGTVINYGITKAGLSTGGAVGPFGATNASLVIGPAGTLDLNGFNVTGGVVTGTGTITNSSATTATFTAGNNNTTANLASMLVVGNVQLQLAGTGWNNANGNSLLNVANTHTGGTLLANGNAANWRYFGIGFGYGTVTFSNGSFFIPSVGATSYNLTNNVYMLGNGTVNEDSTAGTTRTWSGNWTGTGTMTFSTGHSLIYGLSGDLSAFQGTISVNTANAFQLTSANNTNASQAVINLLVSGANFQYTGGANQTVQLGDLNTTGNAGTATVKGTVVGTTTWQVGTKNLNSTFGGTIVDNGTALSAVTKVGTGIWTLSGANSYSGATIVSNGLLIVNGSLSGGGAVTVFGPGGLGGSGTISGAVTFTNNAVYTNGTGATLICGGGLTLNSGNILNFGLGTASDSITVNSGTFANNATTTPVTVNIQNLAGFSAGNTYTLISNAGITSTNNFVLGSVPQGYSGVLLSDGTDLQVAISLNALSTAWWRGSANGSWANTSPYNWNTDQSSGINAGNYPSTPTAVNFSANGAANLNTTLGQNFTINSLTFDTAASASIGGANALTVNSGITNGSAAGNNFITNASVVLGLDQTWANNSGNPLTVGASISGGHALTTATSSFPGPTATARP